MKHIRKLFSLKKNNKEYHAGERRYLKITDYSQWLLVRLLVLFFIFYITLIPVVKYFMAVFENREITYGQAAVFIMQTLTTTGYGELLPFYSLPMVILSIILMLVGVIMIFIIAGTLMATLIEKSITPKAPTHTNLSGHIIFTLYHKNITHMVKYLRNNDIPYVVAAGEQSEAVNLIEKGINCVCADPGTKTGLKQLGIERARLVIASSDDTTNINIILGVSTNSSVPILAAMENETRAQLAYAAGANYVVVIEEKLGQHLVDWICADAIITDFLNLIDVSVSEKILKQLKPSIIHVGDYQEFSNKTLGDIKLRTVTGATVVAVWHTDGTITKPTADTKIDGTTLIVLGTHDDVDHLASFLGGPGPGKQVVLVGAGRVGQEAGKNLNQAGIYPHVIDIKGRPLNFHGELIVGDGTFSSVLEKAHIREADTLFVTLHDDNLNIFTTLAGRQLNPEINIVSRAVSVEAISRLLEAGAKHVLSESVFSFQLLQVAMVKMGVIPKLSDFMIREITWNKPEISIQELTSRNDSEILIICLVKGKKVIKPTVNSIIETNDRFVILGTHEDIQNLLN